MLALHTLVLLAWVALCAVQDAHQRRISNALTFTGIVCALGYVLWTARSWLDVAWPQVVLGCVWVLLLTLPGYRLKRFGAGDVKLMLFVALASGPQHVLLCLVVAGFSCGLWALGWSLLQRPKTSHPTSGKWPFAPFIFVGLLVACVFLNLSWSSL